ncbi:MAG: AAA family ATPase [Casimicrobium sp.]
MQHISAPTMPTIDSSVSRLPMASHFRPLLKEAVALYWCTPLLVFGLAVWMFVQGNGAQSWKGTVVNSELIWTSAFIAVACLGALKWCNAIWVALALAGLIRLPVDAAYVQKFPFLASIAVSGYFFIFAAWFWRWGNHLSMYRVAAIGWIIACAYVYWGLGHRSFFAWDAQISAWVFYALAAVYALAGIPLVVVRKYDRRIEMQRLHAHVHAAPSPAQAAGPSLRLVPTAPVTQEAPEPPTLSNKAVPSRKTLDDIKGMRTLKGDLRDAMSKFVSSRGEQNGILFHGAPGNGKTLFAEALAGEFDLPLIVASFGTVASKWTNQTTENAMRVFDDALAQAPCVLFLDECEAILCDRGSGVGTPEAAKTTAAIIERMTRLRGTGVILMAATNMFDKLDPASIREGRFDVKIHVPNPDTEGRRDLLTSVFSEYGVASRLPTELREWLVVHYSGFSVSRIVNVARRTAERVLQEQLPYATAPLFLAQLRAAQSPPTFDESTLDLADLQLSAGSRDHIDRAVRAMSSLYDFNAAGGELTKGMLFFGPPGTGKTAAARAIAKAAQWGLLTTSGSDLARNQNNIDEILDRAIAMKPCVLFVDEAEPLIQSRSSSWNSDAAAKFLSRTGSNNADLTDVLLIAATNFPEGVDAAMLRGGRFETHIQFELPDIVALRGYLWRKLSAVSALSEDETTTLADTLVGKSLADVDSIIRAARNQAADRAMRTGDKANIVLDDFGTPRQS